VKSVWVESKKGSFARGEKVCKTGFTGSTNKGVGKRAKNVVVRILRNREKRVGRSDRNFERRRRRRFTCRAKHETKWRAIHQNFGWRCGGEGEKYLSENIRCGEGGKKKSRETELGEKRRVCSCLVTGRGDTRGVAFITITTNKISPNSRYI